ncbi:16S rRNA (guanine(527)-N(7))-methyltransferase RsmG [Martelella lutilitoris]|uniref:Ribosomal RNA small subunit methyltransferase G n=1 Tax=Martelella lutilitoris TaxID=2583532 RepID=A0A7T7HK59_9HYPH|nr:16S rRNA (guanine(527)-N(7))-methyltransferase RsmG [Martelella lutilitoris]QQM30669.1 16S rRNA (guanine(527)-N(7))-methyltransferase RsmG [Martelella lutilitoris]
MKLNGQTVSRETQARLELFAAHFDKWAKSINLVAPSTRQQFWDRHVADSAQVYQLSPEPKTWIDIGSGGGFPGMITAILLAEKGEGWVHLVESNNKKASFLRTAIRETGARASVHAIRAETAPEEVESCDAMSARALADLSLLLVYAAPWFDTTPEFRAFFHKGRDFRREIDKARDHWDFDLVKHESKVEPGSVILEISRLASLSAS